jgi:hypothetical protein
MLDACYTGPRPRATTWMVPFHLAEDALQHDQVVTYPVESGSRRAGAECELIPRSGDAKESGATSGRRRAMESTHELRRHRLFENPLCNLPPHDRGEHCSRLPCTRATSDAVDAHAMAIQTIGNAAVLSPVSCLGEHCFTLRCPL